MTRFIALIKGNKVIFNKISIDARPFAALHRELYYIPEKIFCKDINSDNDFCLYDKGDTQPYGNGEYIDPDVVKAYLELAKNSGGKPSRLDTLFNKFGSKSILGLVILLLIGYGIIGGIV